MNPQLYLALGSIAVEMLKMLNENRPVSTEQTPLTEEEKKAIDAKTAEVNAAVAQWDTTPLAGQG